MGTEEEHSEVMKNLNLKNVNLIAEQNCDLNLSRYLKLAGRLGLLLLVVSSCKTQPLAFPGAEGYGRFTSGGRGGKVIEVTNLNDRGEGSLRAAIETAGARTIVFRVSGTIALESELRIKNGDLTIAGQTAPGEGICIRDHSLDIEADNVILRYLRIRLGDVSQLAEDAISGFFRKDIIIDHCSFSWGIDEVATIRDNENTTVQWCMITEALHHSVHPKGDHGYGGIWGGKGASFHHNLLAHNTSRNPRLNGSRYHHEPEKELVDFRNNVIYNWGFNSTYGGEAGQQNLVANYYKYGPASRHKDRIAEPWDADGRWYVQGNFVFGFPVITADNWAGGMQGEFWKLVRVNTPFAVSPVVTHTAENAFELVLADAGAVLPERDAVDLRIVEEVRSGTATYGGSWGAQLGIIDSQNEVGGWPMLNSAAAPQDTDHDGLPDDWETANGLDLSDPGDNQNDLNGDGYTNLENYLNGLTIRLDFLTAPGELTAEVVPPDRIDLSWKQNSFQEEGFVVERWDDAAQDFVVIGATQSEVKTFSDTNVSSQTTYTYRVRAYRGKLQSLPSNQLTVTTSSTDSLK